MTRTEPPRPSGASGTLRILIRHSRTWWVFPLVAALMLFSLSSRGAPWRGELAWGVDFVGAIHLVVLPIMGGAAAWDGVTWGRLETLALTPRRRTAPWLWLAASASAMLAVQLLTLGSVAALSVAVARVGSTPWLPMLNQCLAVVAVVAAGLALGWRIPRSVSVLAAFVGVLAVAYLDYNRGLPFGLVGEGSTGTLLGLRDDPARQVFKTMFCLAVITGAVLVMQRRATARSPVDARWSRWAPPATVGVIALTSMVGLALRPSDYVVGPPLTASSCSDGRPSLCVLVPWAQFRAEGARRVSLAAEVLRARGVTGTPDVVVAWWPTAPSDAATVALLRPDRAAALVPVEETVADVVAPKSCSFWSASEPPPPGVAGATQLLARVVMLAAPQLGEPSSDGGRWDAFFREPQQAQDAWTAAAGTALATCRPELIPDPPGL